MVDDNTKVYKKFETYFHKLSLLQKKQSDILKEYKKELEKEKIKQIRNNLKQN